MAFTIRPADLGDAKMLALLEAHMQHMKSTTPPEHVWALPVEALRAPGVSVWSVWDVCGGGHLAGCGALKRHNDELGEIKSMRTADAYLRRGVARFLLEFMLDEARRRGWSRLSLETGAQDAFRPARKLYEKLGFSYCGAFADYEENAWSVFMTRSLRGERESPDAPPIENQSSAR